MTALVRNISTAKKLQVVGGVGLLSWLAVSVVPFFPILMALLVLVGVGLHIKNR